MIKVKVYKKYSALLLSWENAELCMCVVLEVNSLLWSGNVATVCVAQHRKTDGFLSWICPLFNYFNTLSFEVYTLIALPLKELLLFSETHSKWGTMPRMNLFPKLPTEGNCIMHSSWTCQICGTALAWGILWIATQNSSRWRQEEEEVFPSQFEKLWGKTYTGIAAFVQL